VNGSGTAWKYSNSTSPVNGIYKAQLKAYPSTPGKYKFAVKGKNGTYAVDTANLPLTGTLVIDYLLPGKRLYLMSSGTGMAPFMSIIRDPATSRLTRFTSDSLLLAGTLLSATDSARIDPTIATGSISGPSADTLTFNLRRPVQLWVVGNNYGILLRNSAVSEFSSFSLFSFYNERAANVASRPKLRIRYAVERRLGEQ